MNIRSRTRAVIWAALTTLTFAAAVTSASASQAKTAATTAANYCDPFGGCASLHASAASVRRGHSVTFSGSVGSVCTGPTTVTVASSAFRGATTRTSKGTPAVTTRSTRAGRFSVKVRIARSAQRGRYAVFGRCGRRTFGTAKLRLR